MNKKLSIIVNIMIIYLTLFIHSYLYASNVIKHNNSTTINLPEIPHSMVLHKNGFKGYISIPGCCLLLADFLTNTYDINNKINLPNYNFGEMRAMAINTFKNELYVIGSYPYMYIIDTDNDLINPDPIQIIDFPKNIIVSKDGQTICVCSQKIISLINAETRKVISNISIDAMEPYGMTIARKKLFVVGTFEKMIYVIDLVNKSLSQTIPVDAYPYYAITNSDESYVYVSHDGPEGRITIINSSSNIVDKVLLLKNKNSAVMNSKEMAIVNNVLFVANWGDGTISKINTITNKEIICDNSIQSSHLHPEKLIANENTKQLYILSSSSPYIKTHKIYETCPTIKKNLNHSVFNDEREKTISILETEICENQPLTFTAITDKPELFYMQPAISSNGTLHYQPYTKNSGIAEVNIIISDSTGQCTTSQPINITVIATGPVLSLLKKGGGVVQVNDGEKVFKTLTPFHDYFPKNSLIELTAIPYNDYIFSGWTKDLTNNSNPIEIILKKDTTIKANFVEKKGYAIIVQGKRSDGEGLKAHAKTCDLAYRTFISKGIETDYFKYDENKTFRIPSLTLIEESITNIAYEKLKSKIGNFTLLIVGHGSNETIYIDNEEIKSQDLKKWLDQLQAKLDAETHIYNINIILGTCFSGSFINELSGKNRIIITSSDINEMAFKGPVIDNEIRQGDFFIAEFLKKIHFDYSIHKSFKEAVLMTQCFTRATSDDFLSTYYDRSLQHPLIDDNNDGYGSSDISFALTCDGLNSQSLFIGSKSQKKNSINTDYKFISERLYLDVNISKTSFKIEYSALNKFDLFWIDIKSPNSSNYSKPGSTDQLEIKTYYSEKGEISNDFSHVEWKDIVAFYEPGEYQVLFFANDYESQNTIFFKEIIVHKQSELNTSPESFSVIKPKNEDIYPIYYQGEDKYFYTLEWENTIDNDGDRVSYDVFISSTPDLSNPLMIKNLFKNQANIIFSDSSSDTLNFDQKYYWKVKANDKYGAYKETDIWAFQARDTSVGKNGCLSAIIQDNETYKNIQKAYMSKKNKKSGYTIFPVNGQFLVHGSAGDWSVILESSGYETKEIMINIPKECPVNPTVEHIRLSRLFNSYDVITVLQLLTNMNSSFSKKIDINKDNKVSFNDLIQIIDIINSYQD